MLKIGATLTGPARPAGPESEPARRPRPGPHKNGAETLNPIPPEPENWMDLFLLLSRADDLRALKDRIVEVRRLAGHRGANLQSVNKWIARMIRCDRFPDNRCGRCFCCDLAGRRSQDLIESMESAGAEAGLSDEELAAWIAKCVSVLVVDRLDRRTDAMRIARDALASTARSGHRDPQALREALRSLRIAVAGPQSL